MNKELFSEKYRAYGESEEDIRLCINTILQFEEFQKKDIEEAQIEDIKRYVKHLIDTGQNTVNNLLHIMRYFYYINKQKEYIHMTKYFNSLGVLEHIVDRITLYSNEEIKEHILKDLTFPPLGTDSKDMPVYTKDFMATLNKYLPRSTCNKILAGNNHRIPASSFQKEKELYESSSSFEAYLKERHLRKVQELQEHFDENKVWFEQVITQDAIEYVKSNQEILSGVLEDDMLYITKIPYDINNFLHEENDTLKKYYACHCSFVREEILNETKDMPKEWCYCSAGFAKHPFETILGQELEVTLLKTPLDGDFTCRFAIDLKDINYKK